MCNSYNENLRQKHKFFITFPRTASVMSFSYFFMNFFLLKHLVKNERADLQAQNSHDSLRCVTLDLLTPLWYYPVFSDLSFISKRPQNWWCKIIALYNTHSHYFPSALVSLQEQRLWTKAELFSSSFRTFSYSLRLIASWRGVVRDISERLCRFIYERFEKVRASSAYLKT